jgi:hypothetical protein
MVFRVTVAALTKQAKSTHLEQASIHMARVGFIPLFLG